MRATLYILLLMFYILRLMLVGVCTCAESPASFPDSAELLARFFGIAPEATAGFTLGRGSASAEAPACLTSTGTHVRNMITTRAANAHDF